MLRKYSRPLDGRVAYRMLIREIAKDDRLQREKIRDDPSALRNLMPTWASAIEKLVPTGDDEELDQDLLHVTFRDSSMSIPELKKHQSTVKRSLPSSRVRSYE